MLHNQLSIPSEYQLNSELLSPPRIEKKAQNSENPSSPWEEKNRLFIPLYHLQYVILNRLSIISSIFNFFNKEEVLSFRTHKWQFSFLHLAVIANNQPAVELLVEAGAAVDGKDLCSWTPLHHAALLCDQAIAQFLLTKGASPTSMNGTEATYEHLRHMLSPEPFDLTSELPLLDDKGRRFTQQTFRSLTGATFIEEIKVDQPYLLSDWKRTRESFKKELIPLSDEFKEAYLQFQQAPIVHTMKRVTCNDIGKALTHTPGFGIFAAQTIAPKAVVGEYKGEINSKEKILSGTHVLGAINGNLYRNEIAQVNDGFINVVLVPIYDTNGLRRRHILIATDEIKPGEQICWNYGANQITKFGPYSELRPVATRKFVRNLFQANNLNTATQYLLRLGMGEQPISWEEFVLAEKLRYLLETPALLFALALEKVITIQQAEELLELAFNLHCIGRDHTIIHRLANIAKESLDFQNKFSKNYPLFNKLYSEYICHLPERAGIRITLIITEKLHQYFSKYYETMLEVSDKDLIEVVWNGLLSKHEALIADFQAKKA